MITQKLLNEIFKYKNGNLYRNDKIAGCKYKNGYVYVKIHGKRMLAHRAIYLMIYGATPIQIDHIDGNRSNNCIENLREANNRQNSCNRKISSTNKSGTKGIHWHKQSKKWRARIQFADKNISIGLFENIEDAKIAIANERRKLHKEFFCNG